jgi:hypothetical protein
MTGGSGAVFRLALYDAGGHLVRASEVFPVDDPADPQSAADLCARAADTGCGEHGVGTFLVWVDRDVEPAKHLEQSPPPDGKRSFGGQHPPVPTYRWLRRPDSSISLVSATAEHERTNR